MSHSNTDLETILLAIRVLFSTLGSIVILGENYEDPMKIKAQVNCLLPEIKILIEATEQQFCGGSLGTALKVIYLELEQLTGNSVYYLLEEDTKKQILLLCKRGEKAFKI